MTSLEDRDYFTDFGVLKDPYDYFEAVRAHGPVYRMKDRDFVVVTGFQECLDVLLNSDDFSSVIAAAPLASLPFEPQGDDISEQIEANRGKDVVTDLLVTYDGERHRAARSLLHGLFAPPRLKANEEYMTKLAEEMVRDVVAKGGCELIGEIASPYVTLVIADLLGVPAEDREKFREAIDAGPPAGNINAEDKRDPGAALQYMGAFFFGYVQDRRANPRNDVLTELSTAKFPDGSLPDILEVVKAAIFLFAAGQDTSAKLLGNSVRYLADNPAMQAKLRADPSQIGPFLEEMLRLEGSTKATFRIAARKTRIGDMEVPAGQKIIVALSAGNRDPRRWEDPAAFELGRPKVNQHLAFGRGIHTCIGAPLARTEVRVILERFLAHTAEITLSQEHHGPAGNRTLDYEPTFIIRGLERLHVELKPC